MTRLAKMTTTETQRPEGPEVGFSVGGKTIYLDGTLKTKEHVTELVRAVTALGQFLPSVEESLDCETRSSECETEESANGQPIEK